MGCRIRRLLGRLQGRESLELMFISADIGPELLARLEESRAFACQPGHSDFSDSFVSCLRKDFLARRIQSRMSYLARSVVSCTLPSQVFPEGYLQGQATGSVLSPGLLHTFANDWDEK